MNEIDMTAAENWDDTEIPESAEEPETEADQQQEPETPSENDVQADQFELKHLDEIRTVGRDEVVTLAQKGMDYDRIRERLDALSAEHKDYQTIKAQNETLSDQLSYLNEIAQGQNMTLDQLIDQTRAALIAKNDGVGMEAAMERVRMDRRERELAKRESALNAHRQQEDSVKAAEDRRQADIKNFLTEYPNVSPKDIPGEVWAQVNKGATLTEAYARHEAAQLKKQLEAERQNRENRERTTGSRNSSGADKKDPWLEGWDD